MTETPPQPRLVIPPPVANRRRITGVIDAASKIEGGLTGSLVSAKQDGLSDPPVLLRGVAVWPVPPHQDGLVRPGSFQPAPQSPNEVVKEQPPRIGGCFASRSRGRQTLLHGHDAEVPIRWGVLMTRHEAPRAIRTAQGASGSDPVPLACLGDLQPRLDGRPFVPHAGREGRAVVRQRCGQRGRTIRPSYSARQRPKWVAPWSMARMRWGFSGLETATVGVSPGRTAGVVEGS